MIKTLAIETSCDDTSIAIVSFDWNSFQVEDMQYNSQIEEHTKYGGVVPEVASRLHQEKIIKLIEKIWIEKIKKEIDFVTVTSEPGLPWSLIVWINTAYMLWNFLWKKVIEVNHIDWHIFSIFLDRNIDDISFPMITLTASWWHNDLYLIDQKGSNNNFENTKFLDERDFGNYKVIKLWQTLDDAAGECFDKVARMLGGPYPGWPWISNNANKWKPNSKAFLKRIFLSKSEYNFSFSWMKSKVYYLLEDLKKQGVELNSDFVNDICYEFQESVVEMLVKKIILAAWEFKARTISLVWWVSANDTLFEFTKYWKDKRLRDNDKINVIRPVKKIYSTDNAAMIWVIWIMKSI